MIPACTPSSKLNEAVVTAAFRVDWGDRAPAFVGLYNSQEDWECDHGEARIKNVSGPEPAPPFLSVPLEAVPPLLRRVKDLLADCDFNKKALIELIELL
jgi:hypothetical protein